MSRNTDHAMFPSTTHDEQSQQNFVKSLRVHVTDRFASGNRTLLEDKLSPAFEAEHGRPPESRKELRELFAGEPTHQWWSGMLRTTQDILYDTVGPSVERQLPELVDKAKSLEGQRGSLTLDDDLDMPRYLSAVDIHRKPGSYHTERLNNDVFAGAEFDRSYRLYSMGVFGPDVDGAGKTLASWAKETYPDLNPKSVLDVGCTIGHSTVGYTRSFPDAEVHAIDVAAPCVRYGHARAVAMGEDIHFAQQNAEAMKYEDESFDLVVSTFLLHETSHKAIRNIFAECHRVLKPGGVMAHMDGIAKDDPFNKYFAEWNALYNNEPFLGSLQDEDFEGICTQAGFSAENFQWSQAVHKPENGSGRPGEFRSFSVIAARKDR